MLLGTHDGAFQCDEIMACAMLKMLPRYKDARILRTRDSALLASCDIVVDVGGEFDSKRHRYDQHQRDFKHTFNSLDSNKRWRIKLSSSGLVFFYCGREIIAHLLSVDPADPVVEEVFDKMYENFVQEGRVSGTSLPRRVFHMVPVG